MQAELIADNVASAVLFRDKPTAAKVLHSLQKLPYIERADIYTGDGKDFASYAKPETARTEQNEISRSMNRPASLSASDESDRGSLLDEVAVTSTITQNGKPLGLIVLVARIGAMRGELLHYGGVLAAALFGSVWIAFVLTSRMGTRLGAKYHTVTKAEAKRQAWLEAELRKAIRRNAFELVYQPQFNCRTGALVGAEALIRWHHPSDAAISPSEFIPIAEETGLIVRLGHWVLERACGDAARWNENIRKAIHVSVNVSAHQLRGTEFTESVKAVLARSGLAPNLLELELTESQLMANTEIGVQAMRQLRSAGVRLALDDFGTGYSSLSYLQTFPVNSLKIDRSFIRPLPGAGHPIVTAIISMAHSFGIAVVAEGVEKPEQLAWLGDAGCDIVQGFLTGRPMSVGEFIELLRQHYPKRRERVPTNAFAE
jgi:EAL domain-containing protein (putative c-di-GMP-specific phosphodiesterase class I)